MKKRIVMLFVAALTAMCAQAESKWRDPSTGYTWTHYITTDDTAIICDSYYRTVAISPNLTGSTTIPSALGGKPVTRIGSSVFFGCSGPTSVTIPKSVTSIDKGAFYLVDYLSKAFHAVNGYALRRITRHLNHRSQRRYWLRFADTYYGGFN